MGDTLCQKCSVLSFDDGVFQDFVGDDGQIFVLPWLHDPGYLHLSDLLKLDYIRSDSFPDLPGLAASEEAGCTFCKALREATLEKRHLFAHACTVTYHLRYIWNQHMYTKGTVDVVGLCGLVADLSAGFEGQEGDEKHPQALTSLAFYIESAEGNCRDWLRIVPSLSQHMLCNENVAWIQEELDTDEDSHSHYAPSSFLPTRLLDVEAGAPTDSVQLVETMAMTSCPRYLALSYCWGAEAAAAQQLKTTSSTLQQHLRCLPYGQMTQVVHDAVRVARALRVRYVWIDALCIIQDDLEDWARESRVMGLVYSCAYVTVCALASASCLEGFTTRREPTVRVPFESSLRPGVAGLLHIYRQPILDVYPENSGSLPDMYLNLDGAESAWNGRAWVYQERRLSRRKIMFGRSRIHLSLGMKQMTEGNSQAQRQSSSFHDEFHAFIDTGNAEILQNSWLNAAIEFSTKSLSNQQDKLPAISGLAKLMVEALADKYVAGLWCSDLLRGLLFWAGSHVASNQSGHILGIIRPGSATYICPSWSWARSTLHTRVQCQITHKSLQDLTEGDDREYSFKSECKSLSAWTDPEDKAVNPYGRIRDARLYVEGKRLPLPPSLQHAQRGCWGHPTHHVRLAGGSIALCNIDWVSFEERHALHVEDAFMLLLASGLRGRYFELDLEPIKRDAPAISASLDAKVAESYDSERNAWGLLICPVEDGKFVRIGRFRIRSEVGGLRAFQGCEWEKFEII